MLKLNVWNTRLNLLEVSYGTTSQHTKCLYSYRVKYRIHCYSTYRCGATKERDKDGARWRCRTDEDEGGRRRRGTKTKTDEDEDRRTRGWSKAAAPFQLTTTPEWRRRNLIPHLPCDLLTPETMEDVEFSAATGPVVELPQSPRSWTYFQ